MSRTRNRHTSKGWQEKYPPSEPCSCVICRAYCSRPGWWTVAEAARAMRSGYADRMMLEFSPEQTFGVLAPAFKGCEGFFALNEYACNGCTFLAREHCQLHGTNFQPLECRFCHHTRTGLGQLCHADLERDWNTPAGQRQVVEWMKPRNLHKYLQPSQILSIEERAGKAVAKP
jgi:hypothetical protein